MFRHALSISLFALSLAGCGLAASQEASSLASQFSPDDIVDFSAKREIPIRFERPASATVQFYDHSAQRHVFYAYKPFKLYNNAKVSFATAYHQTRVAAWNDMNAGIDTELYLFADTGDRNTWGLAFAQDDDSGDERFSAITRELPAGDYRVLIRRRWDARSFPEGYRPIVRLESECSGPGCVAPTPPARICLDEENWSCVVGDAISIFDGADERVTSAVDELGSLPIQLRTALESAAASIEDRSFGGTDYSAHVAGIYAIARTENDPTVVAYAVLGYGSGEPDYNDGLLYGFNLRGEEVYFTQEDW